MLGRLGRWAAVWRIPVVVGWVVITLAGAWIGGAIYDRTAAVDGLRPGAESTLAQARLDQLAPEGEQIVAVISGRHFNSVELVNGASRVMYEIRAIPGVVEVVDAYTSGALRVSTDNQRSLVTIGLDPDLTDEEALAVADQVAAALHRIDAPEVIVGGKLLAERTFGDQAIADAAFGESVALVVLCGALVIILGGLVAASLPLAAILATLATTLLALSGLAGVMPVSEYAVNVVTVLGIGLAVDYSLLILFRFREERAADPRAPVPELLVRTLATAGRAVLVSGLAVMVALAGLFAFADPLLAAMALGGAVVVCLATLAGLTLVPALIALAHRRIPTPGTRTWVWRRTGRVRPGVLARLAGVAQCQPTRVALVVTAALLVLSGPLLLVNLANSDARSLPADSAERRVYELVQQDFAEGSTEPIKVVIEADANDPATLALLNTMTTLEGVNGFNVKALPSGATVVDLEPTGLAAGEEAQRLVRDVRALDTDVPLQVAGSAAELVDAKDATGQRLPIAILVIVLATGALLYALTGSIVVPIKALCLNILTLLATLGVLVAVFQWGWGAGLLGFQSWGALDLTTPLLLFVFIFGLSMDYEVFLLARIKEEWDRQPAEDKTDDHRAANDRAVLAGILATGPVITAAALSIGIVFLGFALGELVAVKEIGVGMAVAVLLDVTVIRGLLLPAAMSLLGRRNWWPGGLPSRRSTPADSGQPELITTRD